MFLPLNCTRILASWHPGILASSEINSTRRKNSRKYGTCLEYLVKVSEYYYCRRGGVTPIGAVSRAVTMVKMQSKIQGILGSWSNGHAVIAFVRELRYRLEVGYIAAVVGVAIITIIFSG